MNSNVITPRFSLLHATFQAGEQAIATRIAWLKAANQPTLVEHLFSLNADDPISAKLSATYASVVNPPWPGVVTSVRNWNAAAVSARGDILVVIADDLLPPACWDVDLEKIFDHLDPLATPFAIKVTDNYDPNDNLIRHPIISRAFFNRFGLFHPDFYGICCDDDLSLRAWRYAIVLDGRRLVFAHYNPRSNFKIKPTGSQERVNRPEEYDHGRRVLAGLWPRWKRCIAPRYCRRTGRRTLPWLFINLWHAALIVEGRLRQIGPKALHAMRILRQ
jgi:GT2 family glycosyltransferase